MGIFSKFVAKLKGQSTADPLDWKVLEEELLAADLGPNLTAEILKSAPYVFDTTGKVRGAVQL